MSASEILVHLLPYVKSPETLEYWLLTQTSDLLSTTKPDKEGKKDSQEVHLFYKV